MKITGRRLLNQALGWDFLDYSPSCWQRPQTNKTKRWSKRVRRYLEKELKRELNNELSTN